MDKKILLITWGLGYIGSHAVVAFEKAWYKTVILDSLVNSTRDVLAGIEAILDYTPDFHEVDIRDAKALESIFSMYEFDGVIHFAGLKAFWESTTYPYMYFDNNVTGTLTLLDIMDRFGVHNIVFSSSASVYDASNTPPFTEDMRLGTTNPYATSKLNIENILRDYANQKGFRTAILRYFNLVWAHPSGLLWDFPRGNHGSLSSNIFDVVFGKKLKLYIYGDDFPTPDGTAIRDYIDVCDLVSGHLFAYEWTEKESKWAWDVWNLGTGKGTSVRELITTTEEIIEKAIPVEVIPRRNIDLATPISNPKKAETELGWTAKVSLRESIENAYTFLKKKRDQNIWKQKRVVHFVPYFPPHAGWLEMYAKEWAENYAKESGSILVATFSPGQQKKNRVQDGYEVIVLPAFDIIHNFPFPKFWLPSFWKGISKIKKYNPDIIHTHTRFFLSTFLGWLFAKYHHIPWIHIEHGSGFVVTNKKFVSKMSRIYDMSIGKWCLSHADAIIAVSEACEHFVRDTFAVKNVRTIYRGIDPNFGIPNRSKKEVSIGYIGRLVDLKGVDILIEAFARLLETEGKKWAFQLKIVGDGPERKALEKLVEKLNIEKHVEFFGSKPIDFVRGELLPSLHIFVNPSLQEWLPTTVIEALAAQCRVVATDVWGTREILRYASFTLVAPRSVRALTDGMIHEIDILSTLPARPLPVSLFSWEQTFREVREVYNTF